MSEEYKTYLLARYISNNLSEDELDEFNALLNDPSFQLRLDQLKQKISIQKANSSFKDFSQLLRISKRRKLKRSAKIIAPLAAAAIIFFLCVKVFFSDQTSKKPIIVYSGSIFGEITLKNKHGESIISNNSITQVVNNLEFKTVDGELVYNSIRNDEPYLLNELTVPAGKSLKMILSDGTRIHLNSESTLKFPTSFSNTIREVYLTGEAYFDVKKQSSAPFIVNIGNAKVEVLGTEFNANSYSRNIKVALVNGSVNIKTTTELRNLQPGEMATYCKDSVIKIAEFDRRRELSWIRGLYYFNNEYLKNVLTILPRCYGIEVRIENENVLERRFTGGIDIHQPVEDFLQAVFNSNGIHYSYDSLKRTVTYK